MQLSLPLNGFWVSFSLRFVLSYSFVQFQDLGQNINHSHFIQILVIVVKWVRRYKPKLVRHMAKSLTWWWEWKNSFDQGFSLVSSMLIVLWALCLSEHMLYQCRSDFPPVFIFPLLWPVLDPDPAPQTLWTLSCLWRSLSRQAIFYSISPVSKVWIMCLCCPHNCLVSLKYDRVTKCLEGRFTNFIDLDFKPLMCFKECINQRDWHQQAFHWVQKKREPLKIARLCCNKLMECDLLALPPSTDNIRNITNTAMVFHIHPFDWTKTKGKCSILDYES